MIWRSYDFNFQFSCDWRDWARYYIFIGNLKIPFHQLPVQVVWTVFYFCFFFFFICRSMYLTVWGAVRVIGVVPDTSSLWDICIISSFSIFVACFFTIIMVSFKNQKSYNYAFYALFVDSLLLTRSWRYSFLYLGSIILPFKCGSIAKRQQHSRLRHYFPPCIWMYDFSNPEIGRNIAEGVTFIVGFLFFKLNINFAYFKINWFLNLIPWTGNKIIFQKEKNIDL